MNTARSTAQSRRDFVKIAGVGAVSLLAKGASVMPAGEDTAGQATRAARSVLLTGTGGVRATAYVMSGKIARRKGLIVCTWLDVERQNR
ncbi:MAG: hypothetical protein JJ992_19360, partial [Planctomycetes bacterium]|nr:hypothetical protein [Planctomycetota bacterium]